MLLTLDRLKLCYSKSGFGRIIMIFKSMFRNHSGSGSLSKSLSYQYLPAFFVHTDIDPDTDPDFDARLALQSECYYDNNHKANGENG